MRALFVSLFIFCQFLGLSQFARFRHITVEDGLAQNSISALAQDAQGFIWIATYEGLHRYDGVNLVPYKAQGSDTSKLYSNAVKCLFADPDGTLWGGTIGGGMFRLNPVTGRTSKYFFDSTKTNCISSNNVYAIKEFEPGKLYIATNDGLNIYDKKSGAFSVVRRMGKNSIPFLSDNIRGLSKDTRGHLWFAHLNAGVTDYDPVSGKCIYYSANSSEAGRQLSSNNIRSIFADSKGLLWISCWNSGVNLIDTRNGKLYHSGDTTCFAKDLEKAALVSSFFEDHLNNIWFATAEHGIGKFEAGTYKFAGYFESNKDDPETINDNTTFSIMEDKTGLLWVATWKGGVNIVDPKTLDLGHFKHENNNPASLHNNTVLSFAKKSKDEVYVGTGGAVSIFNTRKKNFSPFPLNEKDGSWLRHNSIVNYIFTDSDSSVWFSTQGGYPYRYFPRQNNFVNYAGTTDSTSFSYHTSSWILKDLKGRLWIATAGGGLNQYNYGSDNFTWVLSNKDDPKTISSNNISCMVLDKSGKIWIGSYDNGLSLFDPDSRTARQYVNRPNGKPYFPDVLISSLCLDSKNRLWVGTTSGLCVLDQAADSAITFTMDPSFTSVIYAINEDKAGNIWFATSSGLTKFDPHTKHFKTFTTTQGVQGKEFSVSASYKDGEGRLYFGGINGFNVFFPEHVNFESIPPPVVFTSFSVLNKPYSLPEQITHIKEILLDYKDYFFSFEFAALDFKNPSRNKYEYKLEGFNDNWVSIGTEHSVTFTNLDHGEYTLLVRALNSDGTWSKVPATVKIIITPPFWRTTWFYLICALSALLIIYGYIKFRERQLRHEKMILENKVEERTTELKIEKQKVETAHKDIKDSINYAKKIQEAILPEEEEIRSHLKDYFILYKPKDIVAGDFYWFHAVSSEMGVRNSDPNSNPEHDDKNKRGASAQFLIAAADCTGHGVPGAFMSMIGSTFLNEIVRKGITMPDKILNELNVNVRRALKQHTEGSQSRDGMDIALCLVDLKKLKLYYSGANRPCLIVRGHEISEHKADKFPVGGLYTGAENKFTLNEIDLMKDDMIYLFSDGYADQFGGPKGKKFMHKNLKELLISASHLEMTVQKEKLDKTINEWRGRSEQVDDILVIGIKV
jgi:ligand-binding sensor domain-containing protein/serine phosphatase RsbU (regulator of sigma subunit)